MSSSQSKQHGTNAHQSNVYSSVHGKQKQKDKPATYCCVTLQFHKQTTCFLIGFGKCHVRNAEISVSNDHKDFTFQHREAFEEFHF